MTESADLVRRTEPLPDARGRPAITQGAYGSRGNLELVFADPDDGLWVCWFNNDDHLAPAERGALAGEWSGGLHFAAGRTYDSVAITQARRGPDFLELVAASGSRLEHWTWTPTTGFALREVIADAPDIYASTIRETADGLAVATVSPTQVRVWTATASTELLHWESEAPIELPADATAAAVRLDRNANIRLAIAAEGRLLTPLDRIGGAWDAFAGSTGQEVHALELVETPSVETVAVAATDAGIHVVTKHQVLLLSTLDCSSLDVAISTTPAHGAEHRLEVVARDRGALVHLRARLGASGTVSGLESSRRIESTVWWPSTDPVHRRS